MSRVTGTMSELFMAEVPDPYDRLALGLIESSLKTCEGQIKLAHKGRAMQLLDQQRARDWLATCLPRYLDALCTDDLLRDALLAKAERVIARYDEMARVPKFSPIVRSIGDTRPWRIQIRDPDNFAPIDLTGATVTLDVLDAQLWAGEDFDAPDSEWNSVGSQTTNTLTVSAGSCTIVTAASGIVKYTPVAADVDTAGTYYYQAKAVLSDSSIVHWPPVELWDEVYIRIGPALSDLR